MFNSLVIFNRFMRKVLKGLDYIDSFVDDIFIYIEIFEEYIVEFKKVLDRLWKVKLIVKLLKCEIVQIRLQYLGYIVGGGII